MGHVGPSFPVDTFSYLTSRRPCTYQFGSKKADVVFGFGWCAEDGRRKSNLILNKSKNDKLALMPKELPII